MALNVMADKDSLARYRLELHCEKPGIHVLSASLEETMRWLR
jgi:hypothetical protein